MNSVSPKAVKSWREQIERGWSEAKAGKLADGPKVMRAIKKQLKAQERKLDS